MVPRWRSPRRIIIRGGHDIAKKGVAPDVTIALDKDVKSVSDNDNQAMKAISILKEEMAKAQ